MKSAIGKNALFMAPDDEKPDVLTSLPRTRPQRRSAKRDAPKKAAPPAKARATPAKTAPAAGKAAPKPRATAKPGSKPKAKPQAKAKPRMKAVPPPIPPAGFAPPRDTQERPAPSGVELVGTAIQAAGELAQIGAAVGKQALQSALGRLRR